jgi:cyclopropane fatty-acyl-phospholipid synthase-like methyltransferase
MKERSPDVVDMLQSIYGLLDLEDASNILDIGCADGYDLWQISKLASFDCHFWGVDSSSKAIRTAQAENVFDGRFEFLVKDVSRCGAGRLLLAYLQEGLDVEGVDISGDMLAVCREAAEAAGLHPVLYEQPM